MIAGFYRDHERPLVFGAASRLAAGVFATEIGVVDLNQIAELTFSVALSHGLHELVLESPRGAVADAQVTHQFQSGDVGLALGQQVQSKEPECQRQLAVVEHGTGAQAGLTAAGATLPELSAATAKRAVRLTLAARTDKTIRPTLLQQRLLTGGFMAVRAKKGRQRQTGLKLNAIHGHDGYSTGAGSPALPPHVAWTETWLKHDANQDYRWSDQKASRFIESIALNIPVPVFYFAEESDGTFSVIDGQQRLTSLFRYLKPQELSSVFGDEIRELTLVDLKVRSDLNSKKYADLDRSERALLSKRPLRCLVVLNESDEALKFEVFERLNTGSVSLTDQEVRNCLYRGPLNELLKELAENSQFQQLISLPAAAQKNMKDVELVLRFFAYRELTQSSNYSDSYKEHLNNFMEENRELSEKRRAQMKAVFEQTVAAIYSLLGPAVAFRKPLDLENPETSAFANNLINGSIYESQMASVSRLVEAGKPIPNDLRSRLVLAFRDPSYTGAVLQGGTAKKSKVLARTRVLDTLLA